MIINIIVNFYKLCILSRTNSCSLNKLNFLQQTSVIYTIAVHVKHPLTAARFLLGINHSSVNYNMHTIICGAHSRGAHNTSLYNCRRSRTIIYFERDLFLRGICLLLTSSYMVTRRGSRRFSRTTTN